MICCCESHVYGGKVALNIISNDLAQVSVPAKNGSQQLSTFTHAIKGPPLTCPLKPIVDQYFHSYSSPTRYSQTTKISETINKTFAALIVLLKS
jgi:hypothetical protein